MQSIKITIRREITWYCEIFSGLSNWLRLSFHFDITVSIRREIYSLYRYLTVVGVSGENMWPRFNGIRLLHWIWKLQQEEIKNYQNVTEATERKIIRSRKVEISFIQETMVIILVTETIQKSLYQSRYKKGEVIIIWSLLSF